MEILSFDVEGKFAHFRKFHGNNTAMSYSIPPRVTLIGMLAALKGEPKDSYYEKFKSHNLKVGVRVLTGLKKSFHRLNFLSIKGKDDFRGQKGRIQTPFEVITGDDVKQDHVRYRVYLAGGEDAELYATLKEYLSTQKRHYNLTLGTANFSAFASNVQVRESEAVEVNDEWTQLHSACNSDQVTEIDFPDDPHFRFNHIEEELMPADFIGGDKGREVYRMNRLLFTTQNFPLHVKLQGRYHRIITEGDSSENIQFMEYAGVFSQQGE